MIQFDPSQLLAIDAALSQPDAIINGGAGCGKTTIIREIANRLGRCLLVAPTGKAACRLSEGTGRQAVTIHRALMYDGVKFRREAALDLPVICDEASMVDSVLMAAVLKYRPPKLILVGDQAQLPPVGNGQPFHDLIEIRTDLVSTLTTCWRASGAVHLAASKIRAGLAPDVRMDSGGELWQMRETGGPGPTMAVIRRWVESGQYRPDRDIFLAPQYGSETEEEALDGGIHAINRTIKAVINPSPNGEPITVNDRVLVLKNFGTDDLWNGDLGVVTAIDHRGLPQIKLDRDCDMAGNLKPEAEIRILTKPQAKEIALAYCLSIHKAQGSQFERVFVVTFQRHQIMLSRPLIYTAITRAQKACIVLGQMSAFIGGLNKVLSKRTVLRELAGIEQWRDELPVIPRDAYV